MSDMLQDRQAAPGAEHDDALQGLLRAAAHARLDRVTAGGGADRHSCAVVVGDFTPESFARGTLDFALSLSVSRADRWLRTFTRTVFLAGRPDSVSRRFPEGLRSPDGRLYWVGPAPTESLRGLSRLLRAFVGPAPLSAPPPFAIRLQGRPSGCTARAVISTGGVSVQEYLVHVHHLFAEAVVNGLVRAGDTVEVAHRATLDGPEVRDALAAGRTEQVETRVAPAAGDGDRLRLYALLESDRKRDKA